MPDNPILAHARVVAAGREPERWLLVLHGIYGAGRNWGTIARRLADARPEWGAVLVDLRNHGQSRGFAGPHTIAASAADVDRLVEHLDLHAAAVLGHSFGGKVAFTYWRHHGDDDQGLDGRSTWPCARGRDPWAISRPWEPYAHIRLAREAVEGLTRAVSGRGAQWMAINLEARRDLRWRLDFAAWRRAARLLPPTLARGRSNRPSRLHV